MSIYDGDIILKSPDHEFLRFKGDGTILVEGRPVVCDEQLVGAFRRWLAGGTTTHPDGRKEKLGAPDPCDGHTLKKDGECPKCLENALVIESQFGCAPARHGCRLAGTRGGDTTFMSGKGLGPGQEGGDVTLTNWKAAMNQSN